MARTVSVRREVDWRRLADRLLFGSSLSLLVAAVVLFSGPAHLDARAYWDAWPNLFDAAVVGGREAHLYSPAFAQLIWPLTLLPLTPFAVLWTILHAASLVYLAGWRLAGFVAVMFYPAYDDITIGNIHLFMAVAVALGYRYGVGIRAAHQGHAGAAGSAAHRSPIARRCSMAGTGRPRGSGRACRRGA